MDCEADPSGNIKSDHHPVITTLRYKLKYVAKTEKLKRRKRYAQCAQKQREEYNEEVAAVAKDLNVEPKDVLQMEDRLSARDLPFDANPADDDEQLAPAAYFSDLRFEPSQQLESVEIAETNKEQLLAALGNLDKRSRDIVTRRWLADPKETLKALAEKYEVSAERIRQIEKNAFVSLRGAMSGTYLLTDESN